MDSIPAQLLQRLRNHVNVGFHSGFVAQEGCLGEYSGAKYIIAKWYLH